MNKEEVGQRIKAFRKDKGLTQTDLAEALGLTQSNVSEMESGLRDTLRLAELVSDNYGVSLDVLIYGDNNISKQDIPISDADNSEMSYKYAYKVLELFKEYMDNERRYQDIIARNQEIMKQMVALEKLIKGE